VLRVEIPPYCPDLFHRNRRRTRVVMVGNVAVGGDNPIRVQSMTTTQTKDIAATVAQVERLVRAGCEIVRITTPTPADARCLGPIKEQLAKRGIDVPIVADIHFSPQAALVAADYADKVRINPGNYADSRKFAVREYSDEEYEAELRRVEERFAPLVIKCKERGIAMRIGTNHGSLSDRIMNRFGDTPEGMVESALEFVRICQKYDYHDIILSMKASNPKVMIAAYRLLAARMAELGMDYPFHLGVTEAGNGEDGRIKSAIGIGSLLEDGIGDTIRVSLTEEPEEEVPVAYALAQRHQHDGTASTTRQSSGGLQYVPTDGEETKESIPWDPYHYARRAARVVTLGGVRIGGKETIAVIAPIEGPLADAPFALPRLLRWASPPGRRQLKPDAACVEIRNDVDLQALKRAVNELSRLPMAKLPIIAAGSDPMLLMQALSWADGVLLRLTPTHSSVDEQVMAELHEALRVSGKPLCLEAAVDSEAAMKPIIAELIEQALYANAADVPVILTLAASDCCAVAAYRLLTVRTAAAELEAPILLQTDISSTRNTLQPFVTPSITLGSPLCDGIGDAVMITGSDDSISLTFNILQAAGARLSKTDYVACPSCGRTLFDLQETTERIKARTSHLVGVKLAIMGCIVNGPGEMADADFGYVGGAPGRVNLYVGKECVEKGVPAEEADDRLIALIKAHGKWQEADDE
jgi:(E)-4-hydroxy-3-methylbut-2-enyl-diphosphate synthase